MESELETSRLETAISGPPTSDDEAEDTGAVNKSRGRCVRKIMDSDSESEEGGGGAPLETADQTENYVDDDVDGDEIGTKGAPKRRLRLVRGLSDDESVDADEQPMVSPHDKSFSEDAVEASVTNVAPIYSVNDKSELVLEEQSSMHQKSRLATLCDSESSEDEEAQQTVPEPNPPCDNEENEFGESPVEPLPYRRRKNKTTIEKEPKKMTGKEALEQRKEIQSESQRRLRESSVSLPYHKPRAFSLKEFLEKRSRLASTVPQRGGASRRLRPSEAIKMSRQQLELAQKKIDERMKEVQEFYKSESEHSDDENDDETDSAADKPDDISADVRGWLRDVIGRVFAISDEKTGASLDAETPEAAVQSEDPDLSARPPETEPEPRDEQMAVAETPPPESPEPAYSEPNASEAAELERIANMPETMEISFQLSDDSDDAGEEEGQRADETRVVSGADHVAAMATNEDGSEARSLKALLREKMDSARPKLRGWGPDDVIDLDEGGVASRPEGVQRLVERFMHHTGLGKRPQQHKHKVEVSVVSLSGGEVLQETVAMELEEEEDKAAGATSETPGAKLAKLREELQQKMAQRRSDMWQQRKTQGICPEKEQELGGEKGEMSGDDDDDAYLDDEEEGEMTESSEGEEEPLEDDCELRDEPKVKSAFLDEEAEESDIEDDVDDADVATPRGAADGDATEDLDENDGDKGDDDEDEEGDEEEPEEAEEEPEGPRVLKRILKPFAADDSDEEGEGNEPKGEEPELQPSAGRDEDFIPPNLPKAHKTPVKPQTPLKSALDFLTPVSYLTGLQNLNSDSKFLKDSPAISPFRMPVDPSPLKGNNWESAGNNLPKKLFDEAPVSQVTEEDVADLCSGVFPATQEPSGAPSKGQQQQQPQPQHQNETQESEPDFSTQDLLDVCTGGAFTGISEVKSSTELTKNEDNAKGEGKEDGRPKADEVKSLDEDQDLLISQLIDEDEMEQFSKQFESPVVVNVAPKIAEEANATGFIDSDEEGDGVGVVKRKNQRQKKLQFSDDESSEDDDEGAEQDEEIDLHDGDDLGEDEDEHMVDPDEVNYDSEENEVEGDDAVAPSRPVNYKPSDFFEKEAELSESEWGSEDEDERNLDVLEAEQGDQEKFDEDKVKNDLERIHMRRLLDDDNREVKLLQELLLEDGELHGSGRQRQFKWRNIDDMGDAENAKPAEDDDVYLEEGESEEAWRKMRHQREMFLKEKQSQGDGDGDDDGVDSIFEESQVLRIGRDAVRKSQSFGQSQGGVATPNSSGQTAEDAVAVKQPFSLLNKRGSFLSRSDQVLQRLAEYTKVETNVVSGTARNSRGFVFQTVSQIETSTIVSKLNKRKAEEGTPMAIKRLRLSDLSPAGAKKPSGKGGSSKKLFGNW